MRRLFFLIDRSYKLREPVLLVGDTGGGKTTICQILSDVKKKRLHILNCHQYTETSDFLGVGLSSFILHIPNSNAKLLLLSSYNF
jgi:midasin